MAANDDPEDRIRELERPLADAARASEASSAAPAAPAYSPGPGAPPPPPPSWNYGGYGGPFGGPPPQGPSGNRMWWILGTVIAIGVLALAGGIAAFAAHQLSGVRSIISSPPTISGTFGPPSTFTTGPAPSTTRTRTTTPSPSASTSPTPAPGERISVSGIGETRTIACNQNTVSVSGVSNTVVITGHCASLTVSGVQNEITVDSVDSIEASGFSNKVTYHSGTPKVGNSGSSNVVQQG
ncbi:MULTISPECIES: DUF3060 domain-containing protein [unclassified Mycobacterium]|uniref:DUF3060 domain-containing protein n=1 Tax=unclassified Mycobacterium TaxID=2642494 RepID=UPI0006DCA34D|nr:MULTISPECIES: DUF3060 domain-containing protein [unclassified Mycobacterium]